MGSLWSKITGRKVVATDVQTTTNKSTNPDGSSVTVITTTTVRRFSNGKTKTKIETQKIKTIPFPPEKSISILGIDLKDCKASRAELTTDETFIEECLQAHNEYRAKHNAAPLVLNKELCKIAQARANHNAAQGKMEHGHSGYGENIYFNTRQIDGVRPVLGWYSEMQDYNWDKLEGQTGTGHFTQLIWKGSKEVGIAKATSPKSYTFVVANYNPPGNFVGKYPNNISKAI